MTCSSKTPQKCCAGHGIFTFMFIKPFCHKSRCVYGAIPNQFSELN